jgi:hypothetical protein
LVKHFLGLFLALATCSLVSCSKETRVHDQIIEASNLIADWPEKPTIPNEYESKVVQLAKLPPDELAEAFGKLDKERGEKKSLGYDRIWLTGTLITILRFEGPPASNEKGRNWYFLKSVLVKPDLRDKSTNSHFDKSLENWPWQLKNGEWHLLPFDVETWGYADGRIAPRLGYYQMAFYPRHFK